MPDDYRGQTTLPRGIRNNNPGNIAIGDSWQGMTGNDGTFLIFADMGWGTRAIAKSLKNMIGKGYDTIATLIPQWSATDQAAYVANVAAYTTIDPNAQLGTDDDTITSLIQAIVNQENGQGAYPQYVTDADIAAGMSLANQGVLSVVQAAVVQATADPTTTGIYVGLAALGIYLAFRIFGRKK